MKSFILNSSNTERESFIWNMAGSLLMAFQSVIFLMILTRTVGLIASGIFTIAYANANLFLNIGKFGMRNYQVSDVKKEFSFHEYLRSRWITTAAMTLVSIAYVIYTSKANNYSFEKSQIIVWMCLFKVSDSLEDVYYGEYQKKGRLDIASKAMTLRMLITIILFSVTVIISKDLLWTLIITTCLSTLVMVVFIKWTYPEFKEDAHGSNNIGRLLKSCFPVFLSSFFAFYIGNAPKYAIDANLTDELQACYGFIAMPVFVIGLLNGFIFTPVVYRLSCLWNERKRKSFYKIIAVQILSIIIITIICLIGAYLIGIPVLSFLYNTNLQAYKRELLILLLGGGFLGLSGILNTIITIIRYQRALAIGYGIVAGIALLLSNKVVMQYGITGAAALYLILMVGLCICFGIILGMGIHKSLDEYRMQ